MTREFHCLACHHTFPWFRSDEGREPRCPRCGGARLRENPWLLGTPEAAAVTEEEHFGAVLAV